MTCYWIPAHIILIGYWNWFFVLPTKTDGACPFKKEVMKLPLKKLLKKNGKIDNERSPQGTQHGTFGWSNKGKAIRVELWHLSCHLEIARFSPNHPQLAGVTQHHLLPKKALTSAWSELSSPKDTELKTTAMHMDRCWDPGHYDSNDCPLRNRGLHQNKTPVTGRFSQLVSRGNFLFPVNEFQTNIHSCWAVIKTGTWAVELRG